MEISISHNGNKGVVNCIMGFYVFVTMSTTKEVDTHRVNGIFTIEGGGNPNHIQNIMKKNQGIL